MISDIPFPMPRWVICSPSHMTTMVPVVIDSMVNKAKPAGLIAVETIRTFSRRKSISGLRIMRASAKLCTAQM